VVIRGLLYLLTFSGPLALISAVLNRNQRRLWWSDSDTWVGSADDRLVGEFGPPAPGTGIDLESHPNYSVHHASTWLWSLWQLPGLVTASAVTVVAVLLLRLLTNIYDGQPFSDAAPRRLRAVAATVAAAAIIVPILQAVAVRSLVHHVQPRSTPGWMNSWDFFDQTVPWLFAASLALVIAEAFRVGNRLSHDVDGLV